VSLILLFSSLQVPVVTIAAVFYDYKVAQDVDINLKG
jgi:hypothetical protein